MEKDNLLIIVQDGNGDSVAFFTDSVLYLQKMPNDDCRVVLKEGVKFEIEKTHDFLVNEILSKQFKTFVVGGRLKKGL